jgi:hypothetical protein
MLQISTVELSIHKMKWGSIQCDELPHSFFYKISFLENIASKA